MKSGGRGYYRPPSLLSVWAYAPFMHNNAIGPEVCGKPAEQAVDFYSSPYVDANDKPLANPPPCVHFDASVEGRYQLFKESMDQLLNPAKRGRKVNLLDQDIIVDVAPKVNSAASRRSFSLKLPKGSPAILINSLRYKDLLQDVVLAEADPRQARRQIQGILSPRASRADREALTVSRGVLLDANWRQFTFDLTQAREPRSSRVLFERARPGRKFGPPVRRRPDGSREAGADRLPGDAVGREETMTVPLHRPRRADRVATATHVRAQPAEYPVRADRGHGPEGPGQSGQEIPHRLRARRGRSSR